MVRRRPDRIPKVGRLRWRPTSVACGLSVTQLICYRRSRVADHPPAITGGHGDSPQRLNDSATRAHRPQRAAELRRRDVDGSGEIGQCGGNGEPEHRGQPGEIAGLLLCFGDH